jgi:hypothetical protein
MDKVILQKIKERAMLQKIKSHHLITAALCLLLIGCASTPSEQPTVKPVLPIAIDNATNRPFFWAYQDHLGDPLPNRSIKSVVLPEALLSDVLLGLIADSDLQLNIDPEISDRGLQNVNLSGTLSEALNTLAQDNDFFVLRQGQTLYLKHSLSYTVPLPPLGFFSDYQRDNPKSNAALYNASRNPYRSFVEALTAAGAVSVNVDSKERLLHFTASRASLAAVDAFLEEQRRLPTVAFRTRIISYANTASPNDLIPGAKAQGDAWLGKFNADDIVRHLTAQRLGNSVIENGLIIVPLGGEIHASAGVNSATEGCPMLDNPIGASLLQIATRNQDGVLGVSLTLQAVNLERPSVPCRLPDTLPLIANTQTFNIEGGRSVFLPGVTIGQDRNLGLILESPAIIGHITVKPPRPFPSKPLVVNGTGISISQVTPITQEQPPLKPEEKPAKAEKNSKNTKDIKSKKKHTNKKQNTITSEQ